MQIIATGYYDNPAQSPEAALFSLHTLLANSVGDVTSWAQMSEWLLDVGFTQPVLVNLPAGFDMNLGMADKPFSTKGQGLDYLNVGKR